MGQNTDSNQSSKVQSNGKTNAQNNAKASNQKEASETKSSNTGGRAYAGDIDRSSDSPMQDWAETSEDL